MSLLGISIKGNPEQQELVRLIQQNDIPIIFCIGKAGTGKTFTSLAASLDLKLNKRYGHVIYARNPIQLGEDMGALPGDINDKYDPFIAPMLDNLNSIATISKENLNVNDLRGKIEVTPIAFLRGRSFENTIVIIDEAQNLDLTVLKTVLTRIGRFSKVILLGSMNQIDDHRQRRKAKCDFQRVIDKLRDCPYVGYVELTKSMRSPICVEIDDLLGELEED